MVAAGIASVSASAVACDSGGVIARIDGRPQDVVITRREAGQASVVVRPRVLEVICRTDMVHVAGATVVTLAIDGAGTIKVTRALNYKVPLRVGSPTAVGNAYRALVRDIMPDMQRLAWNVRVKGAGDDFAFAVPALPAGNARLHTGTRNLLLRLVGGSGPYRVEVRNAQAGLVAATVGAGRDVVLTKVQLGEGVYKIRVVDAAQRSLEASFSAANPPFIADGGYDDVADPEIRIAVGATELARGQPGIWAFEAEQEIHAAPSHGLDRDRVYQLIESYGAN